MVTTGETCLALRVNLILVEHVGDEVVGDGTLNACHALTDVREDGTGIGVHRQAVVEEALVEGEHKVAIELLVIGVGESILTVGTSDGGVG